MLLFSYVFSAPETMLDSVPGTLMITDCLEQCQANDSCSSINYETGLCVLFSSNADKLPGKMTVGIIEQMPFPFPVQHTKYSISILNDG